MFKPQAKQAIQLHFAVPDTLNNINLWPLLLYNGAGELENFPSVQELDVNITGQEEISIILFIMGEG